MKEDYMIEKQDTYMKYIRDFEKWEERAKILL